MVIVIVSFGLTLTKEWGKKKKKGNAQATFFFLIACVTRQRLSPGDSRVQRFAITSSQALYSYCTCIVFHCCLQTMFPKLFLLLCSPLRHPNFLLSLPKPVFSSLPATSYPRSVPPTALQDKPFTVLTCLGRQARLLPSFWAFMILLASSPTPCSSPETSQKHSGSDTCIAQHVHCLSVSACWIHNSEFLFLTARELQSPQYTTSSKLGQ